MNEPRTEMVSIRLTEDEHQRATEVAEHFGLNVAALFRMLIREKAREVGLERTTIAKPKATK